MRYVNNSIAWLTGFHDLRSTYIQQMVNNEIRTFFQQAVIFFTCHLVARPAGYLFHALSNSVQKNTAYNVLRIQKEFHECWISQLKTEKQTIKKNCWQRYFSLLEGKYLVGKQPDSYFQRKLGLYFCMVYKAEDLQNSH